MTQYHFVPGHAVDMTKLSQEIFAAIGVHPSSMDMADADLYVSFAAPISDANQATLATVIANHEAVTAADLVKQSIMDAMAEGQSIIAQFGAENVMLGLTTTQVLAIVQKYAGIIGLLQTGSLHTALMIIDATPPDANVSADRIKKYANMIRSYLGLPLE